MLAEELPLVVQVTEFLEAQLAADFQLDDFLEDGDGRGVFLG